ncbi:MAG: DegT/DnrJ/EryC1/StrS family aminotransferase [Chloroflexi bacterium]|nr:DegT/DnrJ/EryC1/StrS family aminotransferase [Chloroflexota bacterium]
MIPLVDLKAQYAAIKPDVDAAIARVVESTQFIMGEEVRAFEREFATFCGAKHCIGMASGTAAIHLALHVCGIGAGAEVITTTFTFTATAEAICQAGATPVFVDIDPQTYNLDPNNVEAAITPRTRAIIPVHLYGQPAEMDAILDIARRHNLVVLEDAAQAHGAEYRGTRIGTLGHAAIFSFYPGKNLGAYGDAGAIVTNDDAFAAMVRQLSDHGRSDKYTHAEIGFGYRLDALQAAILRAKLPYLEHWNEARRAHANRYRELLADCDLVLPREPEHVTSVYHIFAVRAAERDTLAAHLKAKGVQTGVHYPIPLHMQPAYASLSYREGDLPVAEEVASTELSLPMYPELTDEQLQFVASALREVVG